MINQIKKKLDGLSEQVSRKISNVKKTKRKQASAGYSGPRQTTMMELFAGIVKCLQLFTIFPQKIHHRYSIGSLILAPYIRSADR